MAARAPVRIRQWCPPCAAATLTELCPYCGAEVCAVCGLVDWPDLDADEYRVCRECRAAELYEPDPMEASEDE